MNILFLGPQTSPIFEYLKTKEKNVISLEEKIVLPRDQSFLDQFDFVISFGYRHIVKPEVIDKFPNRIINLHISYLPYNRGADPNLWSFLEDTPKGVTIHQLDAGLDTGDIIVQKELIFDQDDINLTLASTYQILQTNMVQLLIDNWDKIKRHQLPYLKQNHEQHTLHFSKQKIPIMKQLPNGWDTSIKELNQFAKKRTPVKTN